MNFISKMRTVTPIFKANLQVDLYLFYKIPVLETFWVRTSLIKPNKSEY